MYPKNIRIVAKIWQFPPILNEKTWVSAVFKVSHKKCTHFETAIKKCKFNT